MLNRKTRVLIVDDSILFRTSLSKFLSNDENLEIVGTAGDAYEARDKILELRPDVMTLDVEMPKMDGIKFLRKLIPQYPIPVVVISALPLNAFEALDAGAVDFIKKPTIKSPADLQNFCADLKSKLMIASKAKVRLPKPIANTSDNSPKHTAVGSAAAKTIALKNRDIILALGASTGGTDALLNVMEKLPEDCPPVLVVQHMPAGFTKMFAERLNKVCTINVKEAEDGDRLKPGLAIIAAGEFHMRLKKDKFGYFVSSERGENVSGHCPSVDVMFGSVAENAGGRSVGVILTGMGSDGAKGLLEMRKQGAYTIGQDKESCVVYGMPMVAMNTGAVEKQAPLDNIAQEICDYLAK